MSGHADQAPAQRRRRSALVWTLVLVAVTTTGQVVLTWALVVMHALTYGAVTIFDGVDADAPDLDRYITALTTGAVTNLVVGLGTGWVVEGTRARSWPAWVVGTVAAMTSWIVAGVVLLIVAGINPVHLIIP